MDFFKLLQPKNTTEKAKDKETVISPENEDKKWVEDNKIKLDELADKLNGQEEKDEDDVFNYESLLDQHLEEKQKELANDIEAMEKAKPSAVADFGSGKAEVKFDQLMQELMNNPNADHDAILEEIKKEEDLRHDIGNLKADIELDLSGNLERYKFLEKADILPDTIKEHGENFKPPSMELLADQYTQALNESSDKSEDEIKKYKEDITNQLNYIIANSQAENKLDNNEQGMLKAVYSEKYKIEPIIAKELDGNIQYIKDSGMSFDDIKDITAEDIKKAGEEVEKEGFDLKDHLRKHSGKYAAALVLVAVVLGQAEVAHTAWFDSVSNNQDADEKGNTVYRKIINDDVSKDQGVYEESEGRNTVYRQKINHGDENNDKSPQPGNVALGVDDESADGDISKKDIVKAPKVDDKTNKADLPRTSSRVALEGHSSLLDNTPQSGHGEQQEGDGSEGAENKNVAEKSAAINSSAVVDKGEGVSHAIARQLIGVDKNYSELRAGNFEVNQDHLKKMGYDGNMDDREAIMDWAQHEAGRIVMQEGYYDTKANKQIWVMEEGKSAYALSGDKASGFHIDEYHDRDSDGIFEPNEKEADKSLIAEPYEKEHVITEKVAESRAKTVEELKEKIGGLVEEAKNSINEAGESGKIEKIKNDYNDLKDYNEVRTKWYTGLNDREFNAIGDKTVESLLRHVPESISGNAEAMDYYDDVADSDDKQFNFASDGILGKGEFARQSFLANIIRQYDLGEKDRQSSIKDFVSRMNDDGFVLRTLPDKKIAPGFVISLKEQALEDHYLENDKYEYNRIRNLHNLGITVKEYSAIKDVRTGDLYELIPDLSNVPEDRINDFAQDYYNNNKFRASLPHAGMYNLGEFQKHCRLAKMIDMSLKSNNIAPSQVRDIKIGYMISRIDKTGHLNEKFFDYITSEDKGESGGPKIEVGGEKASVEIDETDDIKIVSKKEASTEAVSPADAEDKAGKYDHLRPEKKANLAGGFIPGNSIPNKAAAKDYLEDKIIDRFGINTPEEKAALIEEYEDRLKNLIGSANVKFYKSQNINNFIKFLEEDMEEDNNSSKNVKYKDHTRDTKIDYKDRTGT